MRHLYKITNLINGKIYIGQAKDYKSRMACHKNKKVTTAISYAIQKYGWTNFTKEIIAECSDDTIDAMEVMTIKYYNSLAPNGYNLDSGGCACKYIHEETKQKIRESVKRTNYQPTIEAREKISKTHKGKKLTQKQKDAVSTAQKGRKRTPEERLRLSNLQKGKIPWNKGKPMSDAQKLKCSLAKIGKPLSPETKAKRMISHKDKVKSTEHIKNQANSHRNNNKAKILPTKPSII